MGREVVPEPVIVSEGNGDRTVCLHRRILKICLGISLLCVDEDWEFGRITEEEDWSVIEDPVPIALLCVELDGEASRISRRIWGSLLSADRRESRDQICLLSDTIEHINRGL